MFKSNLISFLILTSFFIFSLSKPEDYEIDLERMESIPGDKETLVDTTQVKIVRKHKIHYISGILIYKVDMDNTFAIGITTSYSPLGNGQFIKHPFGIPKTPICDYLNTTYRKRMEPSLIGHTNLTVVPPQGLCPIPKGVFYVQDVSVEDENFPDHVPKGRWKIEERFYNKEDCIGGFRLLGRVTTKYN